MKKNRIILLGIGALLLALLIGCQRQEPEKAQYYIYYINKENTKIVPVPFEEAVDGKEDLLEAMMKKLTEDPGSVDYRSPLSDVVKVNSWFLKNGQLQLNLSAGYYNLDNVAAMLCRTALVRTLTQVAEVDAINLYAGDMPILDSQGNPVGLLTAESFVENPGEQINAIQTATITLYFADAEGTGLVSEVLERHYSSNISMEKLVMDQLLKGPVGENAQRTIPEGTKLVSVSVLDGVCFVSLDIGFLNQNYEIDEGVVIYSIVNSLAELPSVNKVQISVNGDTSILYREKFSLSTVYERNLDYLSPSEKATVIPEEEEDGKK